MSEAERATKRQKTREEDEEKGLAHPHHRELGEAGAALGLWKCGCFLGRVFFPFFLVGWVTNKSKFNWQLEKKSQMAVLSCFFLVSRPFNKPN